MHTGLIYNLKSVLEQWKKKLNSGSHIVLGKCLDCALDVEKHNNEEDSCHSRSMVSESHITGN